MWQRAEEVPKEVADEILSRWDLTEPSLQRMIVLQNFLDQERLRAALGWYANAGNYTERAPDRSKYDGVVPIEQDNGERARTALAAPAGGAAGREEPK